MSATMMTRYVNLLILFRSHVLETFVPEGLVSACLLLMGELGRVGRDISQATGLSGPEFGVLSRLAAIGKGEMRQQSLANLMGWDKSRLSHQLTRMNERALIERRYADTNTVVVVLTELGREKLDAARPIHAESVRRNLLSRLSPEQIDTIVRVSNLLGEED